MPGFALLGVALLRELMAPRRRVVAVAALVVVLVATAIHVSPHEVPADGSQPAVAIDAIGEKTADENAYFGPLMIHDGRGTMTNINDMRVLPTPDGLRLVGLRRDIVGTVAWLPGHSPSGPLAIGQTIRYDIALGMGWPCWLPPYACKPVNFQDARRPAHPPHRAGLDLAASARREVKKSRSSAAASCSRTPPTSSGRCRQVAASNTRAPCSTPPPFGS